jgi:2-polyprenyl-3-methyl-5-hydroxy-6-metoxy-1,4-benzoquinol methylase
MDYKLIYDKAFSDKTYNIHKIDEPRFKFVIDNVDFNQVLNILDISCGTGTLLKYIQNNFTNVNTCGTDINQYSDLEIYKLDLTIDSDWEQIPKFHIITCMDVLEHIEKEYIPNIIKNIATRCKYSIITVANHEDKINGTELHITREKLLYWTKVIDSEFMIVKMENINDVHYHFMCVSRYY